MFKIIARKFHFVFGILLLVYMTLILIMYHGGSWGITKKSTARQLEDARQGHVHKGDEDFGHDYESVRFYTKDNVTYKILKLCPEQSPYLKGNNYSINLNDTSFPYNLSALYGGNVEVGGAFRPKDCIPRRNVAILIPFRNRSEQLNVFLRHMHPIFQRQLLAYRVFVIEQTGKDKFNKGAIYNIGFNETLGYDDYDCHIFHDVDLLAEDDKNYYGCPASPMHLSVGIDKFDYKLSYKELIGGIQIFSKQDYKHINGYSNKFWGWGGEDDNLFTRLKARGMQLKRPSVDVARYKMNQRHHFRSESWSQDNHYLIYHRRPRQDIDGLNSIKTLSYSLEVKDKLLYTLISINLRKT